MFPKLVNGALLIWTLVTVQQVLSQKDELDPEEDLNSLDSRVATFSPIVTATCRAGIMTVKVETLDNFVGVVQSRDYRKPECSGYGENSKVTFLRVNMLADKGDDDYCGVVISESDEYTVAVAVRIHRTLETAKDKFYQITCGKAGFQNTRNETSLVNLELWTSRDDRRLQQVIYGRDYKLKAHFSQPDGQFGMRVQRCFSFSDTNNTIKLVDERGCPDPNLMSNFEYDFDKGVAEARLFSMFKFPESNRVHFQCDILVCKGPCKLTKCEAEVPEAKAFNEDGDPRADALLQQPENGALMASYSVFVVEPGEKVDAAPLCAECEVTDNWIFWLCVAFGLGFFLLLIIICFLLSAVTCACMSDESNRKAKAKKEKRSPSTSSSKESQIVVEEYDPYAKSWHGSQYGSRFHLNSVTGGGGGGGGLRSSMGTLTKSPGQNLATNSNTLRYSLNGAIRPMPVPYLPANYHLHPHHSNSTKPTTKHKTARSHSPGAGLSSSSAASTNYSSHESNRRLVKK